MGKREQKKDPKQLEQLQLQSAVVGGVEAAASPSAAVSAETPLKRGVSEVKAVAKFNPKGIIVDYDRLRVTPLPEGVDGANKEAYLSAEQFKQFVKMSPEDFYKLPKWKQLRVKQESGLF